MNRILDKILDSIIALLMVGLIGGLCHQYAAVAIIFFGLAGIAFLYQIWKTEKPPSELHN